MGGDVNGWGRDVGCFVVFLFLPCPGFFFPLSLPQFRPSLSLLILCQDGGPVPSTGYTFVFHCHGDRHELGVFPPSGQ